MIATILNAHENSPVFKDTLESILQHTSKVMVLADAKNWTQFKDDEIPALKLEGFWHGKPMAPYRNVALGLMKAWETWGDSADWYCYCEYDCLFGKTDRLQMVLERAKFSNIWLLGNDIRYEPDAKNYLFDSLMKEYSTTYLLGCCLFFNSVFMKAMADGFFEKFLNITNFPPKMDMIRPGKKPEEVYDISEFLYPTLARFYGGEVGEFASWNEMQNISRGNWENFPMRFRPDLTIEEVKNACVMHPVKSFDSPVREHYRQVRLLDKQITFN